MRKVFGKGVLSIALVAGVSTFTHAGMIIIDNSASNIVGQLYNTGLDANKNALAANGGVDAHWEVDGQSAVTYKHPAYAANDVDSSWVSVNQNGGNETNSATTYTYSTSFDLTGYDASTASISGLWGADNYGSIFLNGFDTGNSLSFGYGAFRSLTQFAVSDYFIEGLNTLSVELTNGHLNPLLDPGPGALRFDDLALQATAVSEPGNMALFSLGLMGLLLARRKS